MEKEEKAQVELGLSGQELLIHLNLTSAGLLGSPPHSLTKNSPPMASETPPRAFSGTIHKLSGIRWWSVHEVEETNILLGLIYNAWVRKCAGPTYAMFLANRVFHI